MEENEEGDEPLQRSEARLVQLLQRPLPVAELGSAPALEPLSMAHPLSDVPLLDGGDLHALPDLADVVIIAQEGRIGHNGQRVALSPQAHHVPQHL